MEHTSRRTFISTGTRAAAGLAVFAAGGRLLAACGSDDDESSSGGTTGGSTPPVANVRTAFSWIPAAEWGSWYMADSQGFFTANQIKSTLIHGGPNTPAVSQLIAGGGAEIGLAADELEIIKANAAGSDYVIMAASYQRSPFGYCWLADTPISKPADLVGKRIGGVQGDQIRIDAVFKINKLPVEYKFVPMSYDPQPLVDGEMDVITAYVTNQPISLELQGVKTKSATFSDFGLTTYGDVIFAPRAWLTANRDVAVRYFRALIAGAEANVADPAKVIPILISNYGKDAELDEKFETAANPSYIALMQSDYTKAHGLLAIDLDRVKNSVYPAYTAAGETNLPDIAKLFDTSIADDARK
jgi:ABC-type nitrate/sulfonate/bicarbonate transport system substrate-binding protein